jgi:hypothetical protein
MLCCDYKAVLGWGRVPKSGRGKGPANLAEALRSQPRRPKVRQNALLARGAPTGRGSRRPLGVEDVRGVEWSLRVGGLC